MAKENEGTLFRPACLVFRKQLRHHSCSCTGVSISLLGPNGTHSENMIPKPPPPPHPHRWWRTMSCHFSHGSLFFFCRRPHAPPPFPRNWNPRNPGGATNPWDASGDERHTDSRGLSAAWPTATFSWKKKLCALISEGSTILLCAHLFADGASLVPHLAAHMSWWQIRSENVGTFSGSRGRLFVSALCSF